MKTAGQEHRYPLHLDRNVEDAVAQVVQETGQSTNSILVLSIKKGLPLVRETLARESGRLTLVDPLPDGVLREAYSQPDFMDEITGEQLAKSQIQKEPQ